MKKKDFYNVVKIKTELITLDINKLKEKYSAEKNFLEFLKNISLLLENEKPFLLLSVAFLDKIRTILELNRFQIKDKNIINLINEILIKLNELENLKNNEKRYLVYNYIDYQNETRHIYYDDLANFLGAMALDYEVLKALLKDDVRNYPNDEAFLATTNYFLDVEPEIYEDSEIRYITREKLKKLQTKKFGFKDRNVKQLAKITSYNFRNRWD